MAFFNRVCNYANDVHIIPRDVKLRKTISRSESTTNSIIPKNNPNQIREPKNSNTFACYKCGLEFEEKSDFVAHWLEHVRGNVEKLSKKKKTSGPFKCKICGTKFAKKSTLKKHLREDCHPPTGVPNEPPRTQGQSKLFRCSFCDYKTSRRGDLKIHLVVHSDLRPFKCDLCTAAFKLNSDLRKHKRGCHFNERPYKCDECSSAFKNSSHLRKHRALTHSDLRPFKCDLCDASFKVKSHLTTHHLVHSNLRPYSCDLCDFASKYKASLYEHKQRKHGMV